MYVPGMVLGGIVLFLAILPTSQICNEEIEKMK